MFLSFVGVRSVIYTINGSKMFLFIGEKDAQKFMAALIDRLSAGDFVVLATVTLGNVEGKRNIIAIDICRNGFAVEQHQD